MTREIGPIFRALMRNKVGALLIALQIAVTMTIITNGIFIVQERKALIARDSGVDIDNSFYLTSFGFAPDFNVLAAVEKDLRFIRNIPGVVGAIQTSNIPLRGTGEWGHLQVEPGQGVDAITAGIYRTDEQSIKTFDLELLAGENFSSTDIRERHHGESSWPDRVIFTKALVEKLWPDIPYYQAVGKTAYISENQPVIILGIVDKLQAPWANWYGVENVMLSPERLSYKTSFYYIRTEPGQRDTIMRQVEEALANDTPGRIIYDLKTMQQTREDAYLQDQGMINMLMTIVVVLTVITAMGIVGLASFSVNRRKKQIGTRRALGASEADILRYFMLENFLISSVGVLFGVLMTIGLNMTLVQMFSSNALDWQYIPISMVCLWILGQLAVYGPAKKASAISPALATRSV